MTEAKETTNLLKTLKEKRDQKRRKALLNPEDIYPKRFALNFDPPMVILEFNKLGSLYLKKMRLFKLTADSEPHTMLDYLKKQHSVFFESGRIDDKQVLKLISKLQQNMMKKEKSNKSLKKETKSSVTKIDLASKENLNEILSEKTGLNSASLLKKEKPSSVVGFDLNEYQNHSNGQLNKEKLEVKPISCLKNNFVSPNQSPDNSTKEQKSPVNDNEDFKSSKQNSPGKKFTYQSKNASHKSSMEDLTDEVLDLDDPFEEIDDEDLFDDLDDYKQDDDDLDVDEIMNRENKMNDKLYNKGMLSDSNRILEDSGEDYEDSYNTVDMEKLGIDTKNKEENLNAMDTKKVNYFKKKMTNDFEKNMLKPGDEGWEYDKQVEFDQNEDNDWDEDESEEMQQSDGKDTFDQDFDDLDDEDYDF